MPTHTPPPKRPRGAPPGNRNALKHGFYARKLKRSDLSGIETCDDAGLQDEIAMLRVFIRRVIELGKDVDTLPEAVSLLRVLCFASTSLTRLLQEALSGLAEEEGFELLRGQNPTPPA